MKPYPEYKDSGVEWIGEIPSRWDVNKVKRNTYVKGRIGWKGLKSDEFIYEGPYLVTGTDFKCGRIDWVNAYHISQERYDEDPYIILREGDVLITKDGTIGKIVYVDYLPDKATLNSGIFLTRPINDQYDSLFFYWVLNSHVFKIFFDYESHGSTVQHLYQNVFDDFKFPIPPLSEQQQIVEYLDHKTQRIDDLIEKTEKKIELLKEKRTALINHCVTKGLNPDAEMKDSGVEWIGEIPNGWELKKVKYLLDMHDGIKIGPFGSSLKLDTLTENGIKIYGQGNVIHNDFQLGHRHMPIERFEKDFTQYEILDGDVLVTMMGTTGKSKVFSGSYERGILDSHLLRLRFNKSVFSSVLFSILLEQSDYIFHQIKLSSKGSIMEGLNSSVIKELTVLTPPMEEQQQIVEYLDEQTQNIDSTIEKETQRIELLKEYRQSLISAAVTGKIDVRDWNK